MTKGNIINLFPGGNTAQGFYSFYDYLPYETDQVFIIKGGPGTGKSTFMKKIGETMIEKKFDIEYHWCSSDNNSLDGLVIKELKVAFLDGTAPHLVDPKNPGAIDEIINLGRYWDRKLLQKHKTEIKKLNNQIWDQFQDAYDYLAIAKLTHDEWKSYYIKAMDFQQANYKANKLINDILGSKPITKQSGKIRRLFASALTPQGPVNYLDNITKHIKNRYIIKGKPGTGKATLNQKVADATLERGYDVHFYHCSFDPENIDTVIIPELSIALIDGTPPHTLEPKRKGDKVINMSEAVNQKIINKFQPDILDVKERYNQLISKAISKISNAKNLHDDLENYYIEAMDFEAIDKLREEIITKLLE
jgi:Cdc6-like AAA superfamily ATPase